MIKTKKKLDKNRKKRSLTRKEISLITILVFVGISIVSYNNLFKPKWDEYQSEKEKLESIKLRYVNLQNDYKKLDKLKEEEKLKDYQLNEMIKQLPSYISDEDILLTIGNYAKNRKIDVNSIDFEPNNFFRTENFVSSEDGQDVEDLNENSEVDFNNLDDEILKELFPLVITKYINLAFKCSANDLYGFIDDLEKNEKKIGVKEISIASVDEGNLQGNIKMQYIAYRDENSKNDYEIKIPTIEGKDIPFDASGKIVNTNKKNDLDFNFFLGINANDENKPKIILGEYKKIGTEIYYNVDKKVNAKITINDSEKKGFFDITYFLEGQSKTLNKKLYIKNNKIKMIIKSNNRKDENDLLAVDMEIENNTDSAFIIMVQNDDKENPRFNLKDKKGSVDLIRMDK